MHGHLELDGIPHRVVQRDGTVCFLLCCAACPRPTLWRTHTRSSQRSRSKWRTRRREQCLAVQELRAAVRSCQVAVRETSGRRQGGVRELRLWAWAAGLADPLSRAPCNEGAPTSMRLFPHALVMGASSDALGQRGVSAGAEGCERWGRGV